MAKSVSLNRLDKELVRAIKEYTDDVIDAVEKEIDDTSKKILKEVKSGGPYEDQTGKYKKGFARTKIDSSYKGGSFGYTIWNKKHYQRVHVLEFGHVKVGGGRVKAYPHLGPAWDKYGKDLDKRIEKIIKNGG